MDLTHQVHLQQLLTLLRRHLLLQIAVVGKAVCFEIYAISAFMTTLRATLLSPMAKG